MNHIAAEKHRPQEKANLVFILLALMLSLFCVLKVLRGSDTESAQAGGFWNYISLLYYPVFILALITKHTYRIRPLFVSALIYIVWTLISAVANNSAAVDISAAYQFLMLPYSLLVLFCFYLWSDKANVAQKLILAGYFICLAMNLYSIAIFRFADGQQAQESDIYFSLGLFPFALQLLKNKKLRSIVIVLEFFAVFMVNKRTALISFVIAFGIYILVDVWIWEKSRFWGAIKSVVTVTVVVLVFYVVSRHIDEKYNLEIYYRLFRLEEDGGSGRDELYWKIWEGFKSSSFAEQLFGHGMNTAGKVGGAGQAHNDFLEVLYNYGIPAFVSVAVFYVCLIVEGVRMIKRGSVYAASFAFSLVIGLFLAMFSYFLIYYTYVTCIMAFWGYTLAMEKKHLLAERNAST